MLTNIYPIGSINKSIITKLAELSIDDNENMNIYSLKNFLFDDLKKLLPLSNSFTKDEKDFLKNHNTIKVSNEMDYPPLDFVQNGKPSGYSIDLLNILAEKIGIKIEYINGYTWQKLLCY